MAKISELRLQQIASKMLVDLEFCSNEEQTKFAAVVPFFSFLGYEYSNQRDFRAEGAAGTAGIPAGRADFLIVEDGEPIIAVECKSRSTNLERHTSQLGRYMEAVNTAVIGVLTNGLEFRFFNRAGSDGCMLEDPFLVLDMRAIGAEGLDAESLQFLECLTSGEFDSDAILQFARRRRVVSGLGQWWRAQLRSPSDEFCSLLLKTQDFNRVTSKLIESYRPIISEALLISLAREVAVVLRNMQVERGGGLRLSSHRQSGRGITTEREYAVFQHCLTRLAGACRDQHELELLHSLAFRDYDEHFSIFVEAPRKGHILKYQENRDGGDYFEFKDGQVCRDIREIDGPLIRNYREAVVRLSGQAARQTELAE